IDEQARNAVSILNKCRDKLATIAEQRFDQAVKTSDSAAIERFCKIFPLIGKHEAGLKRFGDYLCLTIRQKCNGLISLSEVSDGKEQTPVCVNLLTEIFEFIAETVRDNQAYVKTYFGPGHLLGIVTLIQTECDTLVRRVIDRFRAQYRLSELFRLIQPFTVGGTKTSALGLLGSTSGSPSSSTTTVTAGTLGGGSPSEQIQLERVLALEPILSEIVLLNTRIDLYIRFMRRHVTSDLNGAALSSEELESKLKSVTTLFSQCQTVRQMQDLIGGYIHLEGYYLREMVSKAVHSDEVDDSGKALRFADDVFFVLKNCLGRALTSGSVDGICAMLNHARMTLLDELITNVLTARVRAGFPSGWMQDAYSYMQSSVAAVSVNPMVAGVSGVSALTGSSSSASTSGLAAAGSSSAHVARQQYLITLNTIKTCQKNLDTLHAHLERNMTTLQDPTQEKTNLNKLSACLDELKQSVFEQLQRLLDKGFAQLTSAVVRAQAKTVLQPFTSQSYELTEDDLDIYGANDPWMENCIAELDQFLKPFRTILSQDNNDHLVCVLTTELVRHMEQLIQRKTYNRVSEVAFYWNSATWRLTPNEVRRILSLRVEFTTDEIRRLKL
ncbi:putative Conserved oligomeric Golgi complex component 4, partial [Fasciola hepatica]